MKTFISYPYLLLTIGCILGAFGQIFLKNGSTSASQWQDLINFRITIGLLLYAIGTILWIISLTKVDLHIAYGFTAFTFLIVYFGSAWILNEKIGAQSIIGVIFIGIGFLLIATSDSTGK